MMSINAESKTLEARHQIAFHALEDLVPEEHLLRKIDRYIDFSFIYDLVEDVYRLDNGRPSIDPVTLIKIPIIQYLFEDTIENNIKFGKQNASHEEVVQAAKKARCHEFIENLPDGYDTIIGEGGASLSGGEKQRISIARAMIKDADIIIFDEATANIDPENEDKLKEAIESLTKNKTVIMIAHRLKTIRNADQILVLKDGEIVERGNHEELIKNDGLYSDLINAKAKADSWKLNN